jgi:hypothetical protein
VFRFSAQACVEDKASGRHLSAWCTWAARSSRATTRRGRAQTQSLWHAHGRGGLAWASGHIEQGGLHPLRAGAWYCPVGHTTLVGPAR